VPWVRFDDQFPIHHKVAGLSDKTYRLHTEAIFWCARNLTDGRISDTKLHQIRATLRNPATHVSVLVSLQLWHPPGEDCPSEKCPATGSDGDWIIHDYWFYQPSKAQVLREREASARRQAQWRAAHSGDRNAVTDTVTNAVTDEARNGVSSPAPARPYIGTGLFQGDPPARAHARPTPNFNGNTNPGDSTAARHPSARTLTDALGAAGLEPAQQPARGETVTNYADQIRRAINNTEGTAT
jgi:hypothetical protein